MLKKLGGEGEAEEASKGTEWKPVAQKATIEEQGAGQEDERNTVA